MSQTSLLLRTRLKALGHQLSASPVPPAALIALALAAAAAVLGIGHMAAPGLMTPPAATLSPGSLRDAAPLPGAAALDAAFWLAVLMSSVSGFRVMDLLMRRGDVRALSPFPIQLPALFADRLLVGALEALLFGAVGALGFVPLVWHSAPLVAVASGGIVVLGMLATLCVGLGVQLFFGEQAFGGPQPGRSIGNDGYGGPGGAFLYAPGVAFGVSCVVILAIKLGLGELVRSGGWGPATSGALSVAGGLCAFSVFTGYQSFTRAYWRMLAGFHEADSVGFNVEIDYQKSAWRTPRFGERMLSQGARAVYRRHVLQYGRRHSLLRMLYGICWIAYGGMMLRAEGAAMPGWAAVMAPVWLLAMLANPWSRLLADGMATSPAQALPVALGDERQAGWAFSMREAGLIVLPCSVLFLMIRASEVGAGVAAGYVAAMWVSALSVVVVAGLAAWRLPVRSALGPVTSAWAVAVTVCVWQLLR